MTKDREQDKLPSVEAGQAGVRSESEFELSPEQRAQALRRARRRLVVMLVVTAVAVVAAGLVLRQGQPRSSSAALFGGCAVALMAAWSGLFIGYARVSVRPAVYDAVDTATRRELRRALWLGAMPSPPARPALAAMLQRLSRWQPWTVLAWIYFTVRSALWVHTATSTTTRAWYFVLAVVMGGASLSGVWQLINTRRLSRRLAG